MITHSVYQMDHVKFFKDKFESIPEHKKIVLLMFVIENNVDLINLRRF